MGVREKHSFVLHVQILVAEKSDSLNLPQFLYVPTTIFVATTFIVTLVSPSYRYYMTFTKGVSLVAKSSSLVNSSNSSGRFVLGITLVTKLSKLRLQTASRP